MALRITGSTGVTSKLLNGNDNRLLDSIKLLSSNLKFQSLCNSGNKVAESIEQGLNKSLLNAAENAQQAIAFTHDAINRLELFSEKLDELHELCHKSTDISVIKKFISKSKSYYNFIIQKDGSNLIYFNTIGLDETEQEIASLEKFPINGNRQDIIQSVLKLKSFTKTLLERSRNILANESRIITGAVIARENNAAICFNTPNLVIAITLYNGGIK